MWCDLHVARNVLCTAISHAVVTNTRDFTKTLGTSHKIHVRTALASVKFKSSCTVVHQIVLPKCCQNEVMSLAHELPMAGHLGMNKTYHKVLSHFFWPKMKRDVPKIVNVLVKFFAFVGLPRSV